MNKFRVWDTKTNEYSPRMFLLGQDGSLWEFYGCKDQFVKVDKSNYIVEYSTGLTDKNGKEIFEGDVIRNTIDDYIRDMEVVWMETTAGFGFVIDSINIWNGDDLFEVEIIGNIHEVSHE